MFNHKRNLIFAVIIGLVFDFLGFVQNLDILSTEPVALLFWFLIAFLPIFILLEVIRVFRFTTYRVLKIFLGFLLAYIFLVVLLRVVGVCPAYINRMPSIRIDEGAPLIYIPSSKIPPDTTLFKIFCPITGEVY